jgi:hypothetical protein
MAFSMQGSAIHHDFFSFRGGAVEHTMATQVPFSFLIVSVQFTVMPSGVIDAIFHFPARSGLSAACAAPQRLSTAKRPVKNAEDTDRTAPRELFAIFF